MSCEGAGLLHEGHDVPTKTMNVKAPWIAAMLGLVAPVLASLPTARAESQLVVGAGPASARVNFVIVVPRLLYLGLGAGGEKSLRSAQASVSTVTFDLGSRPGSVGAGAAQAPADVGMPVAVYGNQGPVTIRVDHPPHLIGPQGSISFQQLQVRSSDASHLPAPNFGGAAVVMPVSAARSRVTDRQATWVYSYRNDTTPPPGRYEGQAIYTVSMP